MSTVDVRPAQASFRPGDDVTLLVDGSKPTTAAIVVSSLGAAVRTVSASVGSGRSVVSLGTLPLGSYAVRLTSDVGAATTAFDVLESPVRRPRYGFLTDFTASRSDRAAVADSLRAFHLNAVQFYDWMYRHAALLPEDDYFVDALGRELSLATVRDLVAAVQEVGALAIGYAAVYGAGREYAEAHPDQVLRHRDGEPWQLGDFLWIMDVSRGSEWTRHIATEMRNALTAVGFDGLHLDQYGDPKLAVGADDRLVDLADGFTGVIEAVRNAAPDATLIFNNVNDFPTSVTVRAPQDVTYIEVWSPHDDYADLVRLAETAKALAPERPVVLAAYLEPFATGSGDGELAAAKLALSTVWASGAQYLLFGEQHGVLTHPYYPNFATLKADTVATLRRFADFAVANGDLLVSPELALATTWMWDGVNQDVLVEGAAISADPVAGSIWLRVSRSGPRLVVQLVDLRSQHSSRWNAAKRPTGTAAGVRLRVRAVSRRPLVRFGHPMQGPDLEVLDHVDAGEYLEVAVPEFDTWALLLVDC